MKAVPGENHARPRKIEPTWFNCDQSTQARVIRIFDPHLNLLLAVGTFPSRSNCFRVTAQRGDGRMSCSVDCLRHADRCAALAEKAIDRETRIMWIRMKLRWL